MLQSNLILAACADLSFVISNVRMKSVFYDKPAITEKEGDVFILSYQRWIR